MPKANDAAYYIECYDRKIARHLAYSGPFGTKEEGVAALESFVQKIVSLPGMPIYISIVLVKINSNGYTILAKNENGETITGELIRKQLKPQNQVLIS